MVIPHYQDFDGLDRCLTALAAQDMPRDNFEIVVADNNSPDGPARLSAAVAGRARIVVALTKGAGPARNAGVAEAKGRILAFTDADCVPEAGWLTAGLAVIGPDIVVGGRVQVLSNTPRSGVESFETVFAFDNASYIRNKNFTVTANLFVTRDLFQRIGPFRSGVSEDVEWCWRAHRSGIRIVYVSGASVGHPARREWRGLASKWRRLVGESYLLDRENGRSNFWVLIRVWATLLETPRATLRLILSPLLSAREKSAAMLVLIRLRLFRFYLGHRLVFLEKSFK